MYKRSKKSDQKIGILTYHFPYNCGAMLQAYALQKALNKKCNCEIINYAPDYHTKAFVPRIKNYIQFHGQKNPLKIIKTILYGIYGYFNDNCHLIKHNYEKFQKYIPRSKKLTTEEELKKAKNNYDKIIVGSDQIWRKNQNYNLEYFLNYDKASPKKYSYAASAGSCFPPEDMQKIRSLLDDFVYVSVREESLAHQLNEYNIPCRVDIDPTFLLKKEDYIKLEKKVKTGGKFIFVYLCRDERVLDVLKELSEKLNAEVIFGPFVSFQRKIDFKYKFCDYFGPQEFLYCVHHASLVITSSFHCTVFSILYDTPFLVFDRIGKFERIKNILELTRLENHIFKSPDSIDFNSDYENAKKVISSYVQSSYDYLDKIVCDGM